VLAQGRYSSSYTCNDLDSCQIAPTRAACYALYGYVVMPDTAIENNVHYSQALHESEGACMRTQCLQLLMIMKYCMSNVCNVTHHVTEHREL
jgi:hypothetical protein